MLRKVEILFDGSDTNFNLIGHAINEMFMTRTDLLVIRGVADVETCARIADNFYSSPAAKPRADNVPGLMVGESHYFKSPETYYRLCEQTKKDVDGLFEGASNPILSLYSSLGKVSNMCIRPARFNDQESLHTRAIQWELPGDKKIQAGTAYMLKPHDDINQVYCDRNQGWEIENVESLIAVNFYAKTTENEGSLRVFDFAPSDSYFDDNPHLIGTGYPYPAQDLEDVDYIDVPVYPGDMILLNGKYVHGVTHGVGKRLVLNSFIGNINSKKEVLYWT